MREKQHSPGWMEAAPTAYAGRARTMPLLWAALSFAVGTVLARTWQPAFFLVAALVLLVALLVWSLRRAPRVAMAPALGMWALAGCWSAQVAPWPVQQKPLLAYADGLSRMVEGRVQRVHLLSAETPRAPGRGEAAATDAASREARLEPGAWDETSSDVRGGSNSAQSLAARRAVDVAIDRVENVTPDVSTMQAASGGVELFVSGGEPALVCGDLVSAAVRLRLPEVYRDHGAWSHADAMLAQGIGASAVVRTESLAVVRHGRATLRCRLFAAQAWAGGRIAAVVQTRANRALPRPLRLTAEDAATLDAMLFGDRSGLEHGVREGFERTGTFHLFVVSGLHVTLLTGLLFGGLRRLRVRPWAATLLALAAGAAYAALTGWGTPVQRALLMTAVFLLARLLRRKSAPLQALGAAALAVLAWQPRALGEASFQMTFLALVAVAGIAIPLCDASVDRWRRGAEGVNAVWLDARLEPRVAQMRVTIRMFGRAMARAFGKWARPLPAWVVRGVLWLAEMLLVTLLMEACMALPMAAVFHRATPLALPVNVLVLPLLLLLLPLAVATFAVSLVSVTAAVVPGAMVALMLHAARWAVVHAGAMRLAEMRVPGPTAAWTAGALACLAAACWLAASAQRHRHWRGAGWLALLATACVPVCALWPTPPAVHRGQLEVTAIDVGQGDSLLLVSPLGGTALVDAGGPTGQPASAARNWDVGEEVVAPYLWSRRIRRLDAVVLTHAHSDHMGGMPAVLRDFRPRELWISIDPGSSEDFRALLREAGEMGIAVRRFHAGDVINWSGLRITALAPEAGYANPAAPRNDDSLVLRADYGAGSALLEGDAEHPSEEAMLLNQRVTPVTLLKVGHHGSRTSTDAAFLAAASPRDAVISVGEHNTFGHPRFEVLERLEAAHVRTFRTDRNGATTFLIGKDGAVRADMTAP